MPVAVKEREPEIEERGKEMRKVAKAILISLGCASIIGFPWVLRWFMLRRLHAQMEKSDSRNPSALSSDAVAVIQAIHNAMGIELTVTGIELTVLVSLLGIIIGLVVTK